MKNGKSKTTFSSRDPGGEGTLEKSSWKTIEGRAMGMRVEEGKKEPLFRYESFTAILEENQCALVGSPGADRRGKIAENPTTPRLSENRYGTKGERELRRKAIKFDRGRKEKKPEEIHPTKKTILSFQPLKKKRTRPSKHPGRKGPKGNLEGERGT